MKKIFFSIVLNFTLLACAQAQSSEIENKIKQELWQNSPKEFKSLTIPDKWKNESAVLLAFHRDYVMDFTTKITGLTNVSRFYIEKLNYHYRIKLIDKAAVNDFSELSFDSKTIKSNLFGKASAYRVIGIKVIKPDGKEKEVDLSQAVKTDVKSSKELKIPIPNLEIGDIVDYFVALRDESMVMPDFGDEYLMELKYPVVSHLVTFSLPHQLNFYYDSYNGAPSFTSVKKDNDVIYTLKDEMRDKGPDLFWYSPHQAAPHFRYRVTKAETKPLVATEAKDYLASIGRNISDIGHMVDFMEGNFKKTKNTQLIINEIYFLLRNPIYMKAYYNIELGNPLDGPISANRFFLLMDKYLERAKIPHDIVIAPSRELGPWKNMVNMGSCEFFIRINTTPALYIQRPTPFSLPGEIPYSYEGSEAISKVSMKYPMDISTVDQNTTITKLQVTLDSDMSQVNVSRNIRSKGHNKASHQYLIFTNYDYMKAYDQPKYQVQSSNLLKGILKEFNAEKSKFEQRITQDYNARDERLKKDIETQMDVKVVVYKNLQIKNIGMWEDSPDTEYTDEFVIESLTKKVGKNLIIEIGKLIEKQIEIKDDQKTRGRDVHMPFARSFNHVITFKIPAGYRIDGLENLNKKVENGTGGFIASASVNGDLVTIETRKIYAKNSYLAEEWKQITSFLTAASDFYGARILLKKT